MLNRHITQSFHTENTRRFFTLLTTSVVFAVKALRDVTIEQFNEKVAELDEMVAKRARHVITENDRTVEAAQALRAHDMKRMGELMAESHASMRDDFEITVKEIDTLVEIAKEVIGDQGGVRMTGGGFGPWCQFSVTDLFFHSSCFVTSKEQCTLLALL